MLVVIKQIKKISNVILLISNIAQLAVAILYDLKYCDGL